MQIRLLLVCALLACGLPAQTQPPIRSWADAEKLETQLQTQPGDVEAHTQLVRFYAYPPHDHAEDAKAPRLKHLLWFVDNHPESWVLAGAFGGLSPQALAEMDTAWKKVLAAPKPLFDSYYNAVMFYRAADPDRARQIADEGFGRYPGNQRISTAKGSLMADAIAGVKTFDQYGRASAFDDTQPRSAQAGLDRKELESSDNVGLVEGAANALVQDIEPLHARRMNNQVQELEDLIGQLYHRVDVLDPNSARWKVGLINASRTFANTVDTPAKKIALLEKGAAASGNANAKVLLAPDLAEQYLAVGDNAKAAEAANQMLTGDQNQSNPNAGYNVLTGNLLLGRVALAKGDTKEAARRLLAAGHAPASTQLANMGPVDWHLPEGLLTAGERDAVLSYLELLRGIWPNGSGRLAGWISTMQSGGIPVFTVAAGAFSKDRFIGRAAPEIRLKDLKGAEVSLADFKGKVVLVDFWATWCAPCRQEMPEFQNIARELAADVVVLAVDVDEPLDTVAEYIQKEKFTFPVLLGKDTGVVERYSVSGYPTTLAIDKNGLVVDAMVGSNSGGLRPMIEKARAGAPAPALGSTPPPAVTSTRAPAPPSVSGTAEDFYRDAVRQHASKDYAGAIESLNRALDLRPDWVLAFATRADDHAHARQFDEALADYNRAIQLDPKRGASFNGRGLAYSNSQRHEQAIPDYTRALELEPAAASYNNRGWAYLETGKLDEALADLNKALEMSPAYTTALFNRAHLFEKRLEFAKAIADYDSILHIEPSNSSAERQKVTDVRRMEERGGGGDH
jgi:tetratricopeptide (TPR) repeat protein/peroxiredoxin